MAATPTFYIKQNDTRPLLEVNLRDDRDSPVNITGATVVFSMRNVSDNSVKIDAASATVTSSTGGRVRYTFTATNTNTAGNFDAEFQVTFLDGTIETFPNDGYIKVIITDDVG